MSRETYESKTFSKKMGEDSDDEDCEEDIDELIMNDNYYQKQNKSSEPIIFHDPLMLDPTNMNEYTIKLIRKIEENLNQSKLDKLLKTQSETSISSKCHQNVATRDENMSKYIEAKQKDVEENIIYIEDDEHGQEEIQQATVQRVQTQKKIDTLLKSKSFWSPGNADLMNSAGNKSGPEKRKVINSVEKNRNNIKVDYQNPSLIESNTNRLLREIAKDIDDYKKRTLSNPESSTNKMNKSSTGTKDPVMIESTAKHKCQSCPAVFHNLPLLKIHSKTHYCKCSICNNTFPSFQVLQEHQKNHQNLNCEKCNKKFINLNALQNHQSAKHNIKKPKK